MKYLIVIEQAATGFSAYPPDLPGCIATGIARTQLEEPRELRGEPDLGPSIDLLSEECRHGRIDHFSLVRRIELFRISACRPRARLRDGSVLVNRTGSE